MRDKYQSLVTQINTTILRFNEFLAPNYQMRELSVSLPEMFRETVPGQWGGDWWPSSDSRGVYFLFATNQNTGQVGLYIGKATLQNIGGRLYEHMERYRDAPAFLRSSPEGVYVIEAIGAIPVEKSLACLAAALEEYLLSNSAALASARILNYVGVRAAT